MSFSTISNGIFLYQNNQPNWGMALSFFIPIARKYQTKNELLYPFSYKTKLTTASDV